VNWGFFLARIAILCGILALLFLSQRFWYRALWRVTANWGRTWLRIVARVGYVGFLLLTICSLGVGLRFGSRGLVAHASLFMVVTGLWYSSALFAYLAVKVVHGLEGLWRFAHSPAGRAPAGKNSSVAYDRAAPPDTVPDPGRRYFFRTATAAAGAAPFLISVYGFAAERLNYQVHRVEIPIPQLPSALDGMKIVQLSDIHLSGFMSRAEVRRAVQMANELGADLAVVTGDLITGSGDPLYDCIDEVRQLHSPLGIWGCNGNHEIYAHAEDEAAMLYKQAGMNLLRSQNAELRFKGAAFNLIGVDYQRERTSSGNRQQTLADVGSLVRRDVPNLLLSHNPNTFNRAAELGIELTLAGHTHGGQIQVEILDHRLSPARFISDYIAGLYSRPLFAPAPNDRASAGIVYGKSNPTLFSSSASPSAHIYVNRGLGTVGAPVRLGVPPEISLLILRTA
jgi:predicted MPP superfamily phosphohydrolase